MRAPRLASLALLLGGASIALGCGGGSEALRPTPVPRVDASRRAAVDNAGAEIYAALSRHHPDELLIDDVGLRALVDSESATRYAAVRMSVSARTHGGDFSALEGAEYGGVCLQGARAEPAGGTLGLTAEAFVFDRALVMGIYPGGRRVAAWVEGVFVYTTRGFVAIDLHRVEDPRWEHTDLEIAPCDMESGIRHPRQVVDVTD
jgi:hypothetical protein